LQLNKGSEILSVVFKINGSELVRGGYVIAKHGCWSFLKGGIVANYSSPVEIFFEVKWFSSCCAPKSSNLQNIEEHIYIT
jgi:hypothetical protein